MPVVYLSLGSNKGNRISYIQQAASMLSDCSGIKILQTSTFYETEPWGNKNQNWFLNAVLEAEVEVSPEELLLICNNVENKLGRNRAQEEHWGERTIDIDILFYDNLIINTQNLTIPHSYLHKRAFVLVPLLELIPDFVHPVLKKTMLELHDELENPECVVLYGTRY